MMLNISNNFCPVCSKPFKIKNDEVFCLNTEPMGSWHEFRTHYYSQCLTFCSGDDFYRIIFYLGGDCIVSINNRIKVINIDINIDIMKDFDFKDINGTIERLETLALFS